MHVWISCVRSRECRIWRFRESSFPKFFPGSMSPDPLYNSVNRGWYSACFSSNLVLNVQLPKETLYLDQPNDDTESGWSRSLNAEETIQKETKLPLRKFIKSIDDQKSSWIMNLEENSCRNHESLRQKRQESWISRFKWFRFYSRQYEIRLVLERDPKACLSW